MSEDQNKKLDQKLLQIVKDFHWQAMVKFGPDRHCDGTDAILYGVLKILGYDVPFEDRFIDKERVDRLIEEVKQKGNEEVKK